jgi:hypothetical protein
MDGRAHIHWPRLFRVLLLHLSSFLFLGPQLTGLVVTAVYGQIYAYNLGMSPNRCTGITFFQTFLWLLVAGPLVLVSLGVRNESVFWQLSVLFMFVLMQSFHIAVRHASAPDSLYKLMYAVPMTWE